MSLVTKALSVDNTEQTSGFIFAGAVSSVVMKILGVASHKVNFGLLQLWLVNVDLDLQSPEQKACSPFHSQPVKIGHVSPPLEFYLLASEWLMQTLTFL